MTKKLTYSDFSKGVGNELPFMHSCAGVDVSEVPYLMLSKSMQKIQNSSDNADVEIVNWFEEHNGYLWALFSNGKIRYLNSGAWSGAITFSSANNDTGLKEFNGNFFAGLQSDIALSSDGGSSWSTNWGTSTAGFSISSQTNHPMEEVRGKLLIGDGAKVHTWDGAVAVDSALTLPEGFTIISIARTPYYASLLATRGNESRVFLWDTLAEQYNYTLAVPDTARCQIVAQSNLYVFNDKGKMFIHNGDSMEMIGSLPDVLNKNESAGLSIQTKPQGMALEGDEILVALAPNAYTNRIFPGVWAFNYKTGAFYHKYLTSTLETYESGTFSIGAIYNKSGTIYTSFRRPSGGVYTTDWTNTATNTNPVEKGAFVVVSMNKDGRKKRVSKIIVDYFRLLNSSNQKITVSIADTTDFIRQQASNSYTSDANAFTASLSDAEVGDMIYVATGARAGDVTFITADNGTNNYSVSPAFSGALASGDILSHLKFRKIGTIDGSTDNKTISKMLRVPNPMKDDYYLRLDFKIDTGSNQNIKIRSISSVYEQLAN